MRKNGISSTSSATMGFAGLLMATGTALGQGVMYVTPQQNINYGTQQSNPVDVNIDINKDGVNDFVLRVNAPGSTGNNTTITPEGANAVLVQNSYVAAVQEGQTIGGSMSPAYQWSNAKTPVSTGYFNADGDPVSSGNFAGKESGYIAFSMVINGKTYYGWIYVNANTPPGSGQNPDAATDANVISWALSNDPNASLEAGIVPEPSTMALAGVSAAAFYLSRRRSIGVRSIIRQDISKNPPI